MKLELADELASLRNSVCHWVCGALLHRAIPDTARLHGCRLLFRRWDSIGHWKRIHRALYLELSQRSARTSCTFTYLLDAARFHYFRGWDVAHLSDHLCRRTFSIHSPFGLCALVDRGARL